jgi:1-acyl-sn-glycerol-3-phosphate acyltransferase
MWAVAVCGLAAVRYLVLWRRSGQRWLEFLEVRLMHLFARLWHRCSGSWPAPLPATGPAILVANHPSHADPAFLMACCPRQLRFLHARENYDVFLLRRLFRRIGCVPVSRGGPDFGAVRLALAYLREGAVLGIFPEGDLSPPGREPLGPGKAGAALLALRSRAPVYPAWITGGPQTRDLLRAWLGPSGGVRVTFGPAVDLSAYHGRPITHRLLQEVTALLMRRIADLRPPGPKFPEVPDRP